MLVENIERTGGHMDNMLVWTAGPRPRFCRCVSHGTGREGNKLVSPEEFPSADESFQFRGKARASFTARCHNRVDYLAL